MSRELLLRLGEKKVYHLWKKGQVTQGEYRDVAMKCREINS